MNSLVYQGDCLEITKSLQSDSVDLIYLDPPFFTQKVQKLRTKDRKSEFKFSDRWESIGHYAEFLHKRLEEFYRVLKNTGSLFFHCDSNAAHAARVLLDDIFGNKMFRAEIIWYYRRWSNSQKNFLPAHQNIYFYSKTADYVFNELYQEYSPSTNVDQILQKRCRDQYGKATYARDPSGNIVSNGNKKGVPLSDVWDIPFLNPKAKERIGYPTQKPILLLERIIFTATNPGDTVLDPFCGSGTTLIAANLLDRKAIGIDVSPDAVEITRKRLESPFKTESALLQNGRESYAEVDQLALTHLAGLDIVPVHRNNGMDALLKTELNGGPVPIRVQRSYESIVEAANVLYNASKTKRASVMFLVVTNTDLDLEIKNFLPRGVVLINSAANGIKEAVQEMNVDVLKNKKSVLSAL